MITTVVMADGPERALKRARLSAEWSEGIELRIDAWRDIKPPAVSQCLQELSRQFTEVILTMRLERDGGRFAGERGERNEVLSGCVAGLPPGTWVDLELEQLGRDDTLVAAIEKAGGRLIRSYHNFEAGLDLKLLARLSEVPSTQLPKAAVMPGSTGDLLQLLRFARRFRPGDQLILGMGEWGVPSRLCPQVFGSCWTYASDGQDEAAPGQLSAAELARRFRVTQQDPNTAYFAIFGNPVMHSRSPDFHNQRFRDARLNAAYLAFPLSHAAVGAEVIREWPLAGVSVTVPHKHGSLEWPEVVPDDAVLAVGAANTAVQTRRGLRLSNTDVEGFLAPLLECGFNLRGARCLVVGAGGAARAVVYGLAVHGGSVVVLNRTAARAEQLVSDLQAVVPHADLRAGVIPVAAEDDVHSAIGWLEPPDLIVQTTHVGMEPDIEADPLSGYAFAGGELVYDIIYTPEHTALLRRAAAAGCAVITGRAMFTAQAEAQSRLFLAAVSDRSR